jgi:hypothetical protein
MSASKERTRPRPRFWASLAVAGVLLCIGTHLVSLVLPEDSDLPPGYYDGDGDDAVSTSERFAGIVDLALDNQGSPLPIRTHASLAHAAAPISQPTPDRPQPPLLRSPPA